MSSQDEGEVYKISGCCDNGQSTVLHTTGKNMNYRTLGLGNAGSVVTAVSVDADKSMRISCLYDPQEAAMPYALSFECCEDITWNMFTTMGMRGLGQLEAELIGLSLQIVGDRNQAVVTTDVFELSFCYGSYSLRLKKDQRSPATAEPLAMKLSGHRSDRYIRRYVQQIGQMAVVLIEEKGGAPLLLF